MSVQLYPVTKTEFQCDDYKVKVNGKEVELDAARVSAVPYNRRWPGHQRTLDQTEMINFLAMAADEPVTFEITPQNPFEQVMIRPKALNIETKITDEGKIVFTLPKPAYFTVEPYGRKQALHILVDPMPDYNIEPETENVIYYGRGIHEVGEIVLKSNQTLFLDEGAVVYACVKAIDADNIRILGRGILDNSHNKEIVLYEAHEEGNTSAVNNVIRQHTIEMQYCNHIEIDGILIRDSLVYNIRPVACRDLSIRNVKIIGCWRFNSDGIDMHNCENVLIEDCFLRTFDDSICVKGFDCYYEGDVEKAVAAAMYRNGKVYDRFCNVRVRNCVIWNDWGKCLEIGAETRAEEIYNVIFELCDIIHVTSEVLDCCNVDYADVHDICYRDINIEFDEHIPMPWIQSLDSVTYDQLCLEQDFAPPVISASVVFQHEYSAGGTRRGKNHNLLFENIFLYGKQNVVFKFVGYDEECKSYDIQIKNFYVNDVKVTETGNYTVLTDEFCENIEVE